MKIDHFHAERLYEVLDALAGFDSIGEDDGLGANRKVF